MSTRPHHTVTLFRIGPFRIRTVVGQGALRGFEQLVILAVVVGGIIWLAESFWVYLRHHLAGLLG